MTPKREPTRTKRLKILLRDDAKKLFGDEDIKKILSHHVSSGMSATDIASRYGSTAISVRDWLRKFGLTPKKTRPDVTERLRRLGYDTWDTFFRRNMSMTHMDAAKMLNCHWTTISHWRKKWANGHKI
jgi:transposase